MGRDRGAARPTINACGRMRGCRPRRPRDRRRYAKKRGDQTNGLGDYPHWLGVDALRVHRPCEAAHLVRYLLTLLGRPVLKVERAEISDAGHI